MRAMVKSICVCAYVEVWKIKGLGVSLTQLRENKVFLANMTDEKAWRKGGAVKAERKSGCSGAHRERLGVDDRDVNESE